MKKAFWNTLLAISMLVGCGGGGGNGGTNNGTGNSDNGNTSPALSSVSITPADVTVTIGTTVNLKALATYADGSTKDITAEASWASASQTVASVGSSSGVVTGVSAGTSRITSSFGGLQSSAATVTVPAITLTGITVSASSSSSNIGASVTYTAMGSYSDGSSADISNTVTWQSSDTTVATVNAKGVASAIKVGTSTISASNGKWVSNSLTLTVVTVNSSVPTFTSISGFHTVYAITATGDLWGWGWNSHGELGNGLTTDTTSPHFLGAGYVSVSPSQGGEGFVHAIKQDGSLMYWGYDIMRQWGNDVLTPKLIGSGFAKVSSSTYSQAAIKTDGSLWVWGINGSGLAGDGTMSPIASPKQIGTGFSVVSVGTTHRMAVKQDGTLWAWGDNSCGALGSTIPAIQTTILKPTQIGTGYKDVVAFHALSTIALKADGSLWSWGQQYKGTLGDGVTVYSPASSTFGCRAAPQQIGTGFTAIAGGYGYAMALKADGSVWSWGHLSISDSNTGADSTVPRQIGTGFAKIFMHAWRAYAIATDGSLWSWGDQYDNGYGNTYNYSAAPVRISP